MVILWIDLLSICLICIIFCDLISIYVVIVLLMLTASKSLFFYLLTSMIKLILNLVNFLTVLVTNTSSSCPPSGHQHVTVAQVAAAGNGHTGTVRCSFGACGSVASTTT
jgi:hypothetical protein